MAQWAPNNPLDRYDEAPDEEFYNQPRFVTHIDDKAIAAVTQLYRDYFPEDGAILDLMSSWVSHLPPEARYSRVVGLGMNRAELEGNPRLNSFIVQNLNDNPLLPFGDGEFDAAGVCVSIQYLTQPVEALREVGRVLRNGAPLVITFSNRCFPTKAVAVWQTQDDAGHCKLVRQYLEQTGRFRDITVLDRSPRRWGSDPLYAVVGRSIGTQPAENS